MALLDLHHIILCTDILAFIYHVRIVKHYFFGSSSHWCKSQPHFKLNSAIQYHHIIRSVGYFRTRELKSKTIIKLHNWDTCSWLPFHFIWSVLMLLCLEIICWMIQVIEVDNFASQWNSGSNFSLGVLLSLTRSWMMRIIQTSLLVLGTRVRKKKGEDFWSCRMSC